MKELHSINHKKKHLRQAIYKAREEQGEENLLLLSEKIITRLEANESFQSAHTILCYYALPFEVNTVPALDRWSQSKMVLLPVMVGKELKLKRYIGKEHLVKGAFNVWEPVGEFIDHYDTIDFAIVPGLAFDRNKNRMGYGKGFYDKLLPHIKAKKAGICFEFQLLEQIPTDYFDLPMDLILTERQTVL